MARNPKATGRQLEPGVYVYDMDPEPTPASRAIIQESVALSHQTASKIRALVASFNQKK